MGAILLVLAISGELVAIDPHVEAKWNVAAPTKFASHVVFAASHDLHPTPAWLMMGDCLLITPERLRMLQAPWYPDTPFATAQALSPFQRPLHSGDEASFAQADWLPNLREAPATDAIDAGEFLPDASDLFVVDGCFTAQVRRWDWRLAFEPDLASDFEGRLQPGPRQPGADEELAWRELLEDCRNVALFRLSPAVELDAAWMEGAEKRTWEAVRHAVVPMTGVLWESPARFPFERLRWWWRSRLRASWDAPQEETVVATSARRDELPRIETPQRAPVSGNQAHRRCCRRRLWR